jgi:hypothetical protein
MKIKLNRIIHFPVVLCGRETSSLTLRKKYRVAFFENSVLRNMFGLKRNEMAGAGGNFKMRSFMIRSPHEVLFG